MRAARPDGRVGSRRREATVQNGPMPTEISPQSIARPAANYAHAMLSDSATRWLHTSGVVPIAPDGSVPTAIGEQATVVWTNIMAMLEEADLRAEDVVSVTTYVVHSATLADDLPAGDERAGRGARRPPCGVDAGDRPGAGAAGVEDGDRDRRVPLNHRVR